MLSAPADNDAESLANAIADAGTDDCADTVAEHSSANIGTVPAADDTSIIRADATANPDAHAHHQNYPRAPHTFHAGCQARRRW